MMYEVEQNQLQYFQSYREVFHPASMYKTRFLGGNITAIVSSFVFPRTSSVFTVTTYQYESFSVQKYCNLSGSCTTSVFLCSFSDEGARDGGGSGRVPGGHHYRRWGQCCGREREGRLLADRAVLSDEGAIFFKSTYWNRMSCGYFRHLHMARKLILRCTVSRWPTYVQGSVRFTYALELESIFCRTQMQMCKCNSVLNYIISYYFKLAITWPLSFQHWLRLIIKLFCSF